MGRKLTRINEDFDFIKFLNSKIKDDMPEINKYNKDGNYLNPKDGAKISMGAPIDLGTTTSGNPVIESMEEGEENLKEEIKLNDELNPKIFVKNKNGRFVLKYKAKIFVENYVSFYKEAFEEECAPLKLPIKDIMLVGSNAAFNYTDKSDMDIHIIADRPKTSTLKEIYALYNKIFKKTYGTIQYKGIPVEPYIELFETEATSQGIYSLNHGWIKYPVKETVKQMTPEEEEAFNTEFWKWESRYFKLIGQDKKPNQENIEKDTLE